MGHGQYRKTYIDRRTGRRGACDSEGNPMKYPDGTPVPAQQSERVTQEGEFTLYDDSEGHCCFCGRLSCRGRCFK